MKATNCLIRDLFSETKQYVVPLFQRSYVWGFVQWEQFWSDITEKYLCKMENTNLFSELFFGSIVVVREEENGFDHLMIIDGQQRLTTVSIFLAVLRAFAKERGDAGDALYVQQISSLLKQEKRQGSVQVSSHSSEEQHAKREEHYVIIPTHVDKASLYQIFDEDYTFKSDSRVIECFEYFWKCLDSTGYDIATLHDVLMNYFCLVYIELRDDENPNQVFEALNYRGVPLDEADLIRNFFFSMIKPVKSAEEAYHQYWKPMEQIFEHRQNHLSSFLRTFFMKDGDFIKKGDLFDVVRKKFHASSPEDIISLLHALHHDAPYYHYLIEPSDLRGDGPVWKSIQSHLERLLFLGAESVYPYLLHCISLLPAFSDELFEDPLPPSSSKENASSVVSLSEFDGILAVLETYFVRREVCQKSRQGYDQLFCLLCPQKDEQVSRELLISTLASLPIAHACPSSDEFEDTLRGEVYIKGSDNRAIWIIMTSLEEYFRKYPQHEAMDGGKRQSDSFDHYMLFEEYDDDFVIDHIMPCEMSDWWKSHLGESWSLIHQEYVNKLGNLTLTIRNPLLSRATFDQKQRWYAQDQMALNKSIHKVQMWRKVQIEQRSQSFIALCLKIWPDMKKHSSSTPVPYTDCECLRIGDIPNHLRPVRVVIRGEEMPVRYWYQVLEWTVETLYAAEIRKFPRIPERYPRIFSEETTEFKSIIGTWSYHSRLGRYQIRDLCLGMVEAIGWQKEDWCLVCE